MTSGRRDLIEPVEEEDVTLDDFWWRLWIGERLILRVEAWGAGEAEDEVRPDELSNSEALVGGEEARGDDLWGELPLLFLLEVVE